MLVISILNLVLGWQVHVYNPVNSVNLFDYHPLLSVARNEPVPKISNDVDKDLKNAIISLKRGEKRRAKKYLKAILAADSGHEDATSLLKQINTSAKKYFGRKHFKYRIQKGDSLSSIAEKYLKDPLKFYALARYNRIRNPSKLVVGKLIKIPGDPPGLNQISQPVKFSGSANSKRAQKKSNAKNRAQKSKRLKYNADQDLDKVIGMLKQGRRTHAKGVIKKILRKEPKNKIAKKLLKQIVVSPYNYFGKSYFTYRVQKGQNFTSLARKFLNDSVQFYALARYNDIIPNKLRRGDIIRIPGIMPQRDYNRITKAITLLKQGRRTDARKALKVVLWYYPKNKTALTLIEQIDKKPDEYFGDKHFSHRVRPGETFSTLAEKFLNDPLKFYALARYNEIVVPKRLRPGVKIKVPGEHPDRKGAPSPEYELAKKYFQQSRYQDAYALLEQLKTETKTRNLQDRENELLVHAYTKQAGILFKQNKLKDAFELMERGGEIELKDENIKQEFDSLNDLLFAERHYLEGKQNLKEKDRVAAYLSFQEALKFNPSHKKAMKQSESMKPDIVDKLYKKGIVAFRRQELDAAIAAWDQVLSIEPKHDLAKRNMERAMDLKKKAEQFPQVQN